MSLSISKRTTADEVVVMGDVCKEIDRETFCKAVFDILKDSVGSEYALQLILNDTFLGKIKTDVEETSAWFDNGYYSDDDIRLAIGRTITHEVSKW